MAKVKFVYKKGAGRILCGSPGTLAIISSATDRVYNNANSLNSSKTARVTNKKRGGNFDVDLKNPNYYKHSALDKKRMARGTVYTGNFASAKIERERNVLLKSLS